MIVKPYLNWRLGLTPLQLPLLHCCLQQAKITHVLNLTDFKQSSEVIEEYASLGITYLHLPSQDAQGYPILERRLEKAQAFIQLAKDNNNKPGGKCLVHCIAGRNRSAVIVAAVLMRELRLTVLEAVALVRRKRGEDHCIWNDSFQEQLVAFARVEELLGPTPEKCSMVAASPPPESQRQPPINDYESSSDESNDNED